MDIKKSLVEAGSLNTFNRDFSPDTIGTSRFGTLRVLDKKEISSSLALPSSGTAAMRILRLSPLILPKQVFEEPGTALMLRYKKLSAIL